MLCSGRASKWGPFTTLERQIHVPTANIQFQTKKLRCPAFHLSSQTFEKRVSGSPHSVLHCWSRTTGTPGRIVQLLLEPKVSIETIHFATAQPKTGKHALVTVGSGTASVDDQRNFLALVNRNDEKQWTGTLPISRTCLTCHVFVNLKQIPVRYELEMLFGSVVGQQHDRKQQSAKWFVNSELPAICGDNWAGKPWWKQTRGTGSFVDNTTNKTCPGFASMECSNRKTACHQKNWGGFSFMYLCVPCHCRACLRLLRWFASMKCNNRKTANHPEHQRVLVKPQKPS